MNILVDTNVVLDLLLDRKPFSVDAVKLFSRIERGQYESYLCATSVTTIHYLVHRVLSAGKARNAIERLLRFNNIALVNKAVIESALHSSIDDFEDAVIVYAAKNVHAKAIITRNIKDFRKADISVYEPGEFIRLTT